MQYVACERTLYFWTILYDLVRLSNLCAKMQLQQGRMDETLEGCFRSMEINKDAWLYWFPLRLWLLSSLGRTLYGGACIGNSYISDLNGKNLGGLPNQYKSHRPSRFLMLREKSGVQIWISSDRPILALLLPASTVLSWSMLLLRLWYGCGIFSSLLPNCLTLVFLPSYPVRPSAVPSGLMALVTWWGT